MEDGSDGSDGSTDSDGDGYRGYSRYDPQQGQDGEYDGGDDAGAGGWDGGSSDVGYDSASSSGQYGDNRGMLDKAVYLRVVQKAPLILRK